MSRQAGKRIAPPTPKMLIVEINITDRLKGRVDVAAAEEGMTKDAFIERALLAAVHETEKRVKFRSAQFRDANEYPHQCETCLERFKLPMHLGRHMVHQHSELLPDHPDQDEDRVPEGGIPEKKRRGRPPKLRPPEPEPQEQPITEEFKLGDGMEELLDTFEERFANDIPSF